MSESINLLDLAEPSQTQIEDARDEMVQLVTAQLLQEGQIPNHSLLARRLPIDFSYDSERDSFERFLPKVAQQPAQSELVERPETREGLHAKAHEVECELFEVRHQLQAATTARQLARATVSRCNSAWMSGGRPPVDDAQLRRDYIASSQMDREAAKSRGRESIPSGGNSKWAADSSRARWGSNPEGFVAKNKAVAQAARSAIAQKAAIEAAITAGITAGLRRSPK
jgi:hypothetical protein